MVDTINISEVAPPVTVDDDEDDFSMMPELCDNKGANEMADYNKPDDKPDTTTNSPTEDKVESAVDADGWEDVLGSGRLRKRVKRGGSKFGSISEVEETSDTRHYSGKPGRGCRCTVNVLEMLDGKEVGREEQLQFNVGESEVMQALDLVVPLMEKGEVAEVKVEHTFAYGVVGDGDRIAPNTDIELEVELVDWVELGPAPDIPLAERMAIGMSKRERGNRWYSRGEYSLAVQCYRKAAEYLDDKQIEEDMEVPIDRFLLPKDLQELLQERVKTFNNMAQAQMKLSAWDSSLASVRQVLKIEPNNEKALFRKSKILVEKCQLDEAIGILRRINRLYPANKQCHTELSRLTNKMKASKEKEQLMSRKMLGLGPIVPKATKSSFLSKRVSIALAALGGLGALAGAFLIKHYNVI